MVFLRKHYRESKKTETVKELHHLVNLEFNEFNYLSAMDEDDEDTDAGKNDHLSDFQPVCVDGILLSPSMKNGLLFSF